ncbi:NPCBM/NEW2 domain-containing protein [Psychrobacillus antarcticus]|uniref:NPCBM/NEW2 domain-containing protein n=1 Tax=Psychrobacillus antarcticus TaxID=2879115 RepID=UPI002407A40D|nr:NPCBM/NEW2 domain-containing protein [Psychrobacillus antarcticus]
MKKVLSIATAAAMAINIASVPFNVLAQELPVQSVVNTTIEGKVNATAKVSKLTAYGTKFEAAYDKVYRMPNSNVKEITTNAGSYSGTKLEYILDDQPNTHWETNKSNSDTFTNELIFELEEAEVLDRIGFLARSVNQKGFPEEFEIYASETSDGETFQLVASGTAVKTSDFVEFKFEPTNFKRIKFRFKKAYTDRPFAAEVRFYKEDALADQMARLFTDSSKNQVSADFNTVEKLNQFEDDVKSHPLYEQFKEGIENAKYVLNTQKIEATTAATQTFSHYANTKYSELFRMDYDNIQSIQNNAGHYSSSVIGNAVDGKLDTYWETNKGNTSTFSNEVEVTFKELVTLDRVMYGARASDRKGFAEEFEIYASPTSQGDTYQLLATGQHHMEAGLIEAKFEPTTFKRIKFKFKKSNQNWATLSELAFYKEDVVQNKVNSIFTDETKSAVTNEYLTLNQISKLEEEANSHPLYETYKESFELAKKIVNGELSTGGRIIEAEQHGNMVSHAQQKLKMTYGSNNQPTGIAAKAGEKITVYVDADASGPLPQLVFSQQEGSWNAWASSVNLKPGKNEFTVPTIYTGNVTQGGPVYIVNPYTPEQQKKAPVIRIEGGERFPIFTKETNPEEFKSFLTNYNNRLSLDVAAHPDVKERDLIDVVEIVSDRIIFTGTALEAYNQYITKNMDPMKTVNGYDSWISKVFDFSGLDGISETHDPKYIRENIRLMQPYGAMYAAGNHTGIQRGTVPFMFSDFSTTYPGWGLTHEIGHRMAVGVREYGEVTNNMVSMAMSVTYNSIDNRIPFEKMYSYLVEENKSVMDNLSLQERLGAFWQLELAYPGYWAELNKYYRDRSVSLTNGDHSKQQYLIQFSSEVLNMDLSSYFARHGFTVSDETKEEVSQYPAPKKIWYLNNSVLGYEGDGFTADASVNVNITRNEANKTNTLILGIETTNKNNLLGYEIIRNGTLIGFTSNTMFIDQNVQVNENYIYEVIAYDKKLNSLKSVEIKTFKPTISVEDQLTIKINQPFDPMDYVKVVDYQGNNITEDVTIKSNVNVTKKGNYEIVYTVNNNDVTETKTTQVTVTSDFEYASDINPVSTSIAWGGYQKDKSPSGGTIGLLRQGLETTYAKGIGAHAKSEVVYNIDGKGFDFFESYIGIDQAVRGQSSSSARFEVWVDGENKYVSNVVGSTTGSEFVKIPIAGGKEVKLITTDAGTNGNTADHTVWADAKFTKSSSEPVITVQSKATQVGQPIDVKGKYSATDTEDGDLTSQVEVTGVDNVNFNKAGHYELFYTVTDSDGNTVTEKRTIAVVNMEDYEYLSNYDWKSTQNSYTTPIKDKATSKNSLRLTNEDGSEVVYEKGIGAHSNSTIVYDLKDKDASYFSSFVGVDRQMYNSIGSVVFQVYVDGVKQFDSGLMTSKVPQKFIEVNLAGAKELKLVVTDGGNGNGSDHATWGNAKLHYANADRVYTADLVSVLEAAEAMVIGEYTEASVRDLQTAIEKAKKVLANTNAIQIEVDEALEVLEVAKAGLIKVDLTQVITIKENYLSNSIKSVLGLKGDITLGDMYKLTNLTIESQRVRSLEGLEYAKNLESLSIKGNEITDFSPLKELSNLTKLIVDTQFVEMGAIKGSVVEVENIVIGLNGKKVKPYLVAYSHTINQEMKEVDVNGLDDHPEEFIVDLSNEEKGLYWLAFSYEIEGNTVILRYLVNNK